MGCGRSKISFNPNNDIEGQDDAALELFETIGLEKSNIDIFYRIFCEIDVNHSHSVRPKEIFSHFNVDLGNFEDGIFAIFDDGNTKLLNFMEYVCALWNLLTLRDKYLAIICYLMKEPTGVLRIKYPAVREMIELMHKKKIESTPALQQMFANLKGNFGGEISMKELCEWAGENASLLTPLLILQIKMRRNIIGEKFWMRMSEDRSKHAEMSQLDFTKRLSSMIKRRNEQYHRRQALKEQEATIEAQRAQFMRGNSRAEMERKQSLMMKSFNLGIAKQPKKEKSVNESELLLGATSADDGDTTNRRKDQRQSSKKLNKGDKSSNNIDSKSSEAVIADADRKPLKKQSTKRGKTGVSFSDAVDGDAAATESALPVAPSAESAPDPTSKKKNRPKSAEKLHRSSSKKHKSMDAADVKAEGKEKEAGQRKSRPKSANKSRSSFGADASAPPVPPEEGTDSPKPKLQRQGTHSKKLRKSKTASKDLLLEDNDGDAVAAGLESPSKKPRPKSASKGSSSRSPDKNRGSSKKMDTATGVSG